MTSESEAGTFSVTKFQFLAEKEEPLLCYRLQSAHLQVDVLPFGATVAAIRVLRDKAWVTVTVFPESSDRVRTRSTNPYMGSTIGRYANRIARGRFTLKGTEYQLDCNNGKHHLHGGSEGLSFREWAVGKVAVTEDRASIEFSIVDESTHYPGKATITLRFSVEMGGRFRIHHHATVTESSPVSLTTHPYFNLEGSASTSILSHTLSIQSSSFVPVDDEAIPTGELRAVDGSPFDFREGPELLSAFRNLRVEKVGATDECFPFGFGIDHSFALDGFVEREAASSLKERMRRVAVLKAGQGGITMAVETTLPALQVYTANFLSRAEGHPSDKHTAVCLETQYFPNGPNLSESAGFPRCILEPGEEYEEETTYTFDASS